MTSTAFSTPALNLKVRRVVSEMSELFRLSRFGDVQGVQTLFSAQEASPDDVNPNRWLDGTTRKPRTRFLDASNNVIWVMIEATSSDSGT